VLPIAAVTVLYPWQMRLDWVTQWTPPAWVDLRIVINPERGGLAVVLSGTNLGREIVQVPANVCCGACVSRKLTEAAERLTPAEPLRRELLGAWAAFRCGLPRVPTAKARKGDCDTASETV